jgi:LysR substrate binding domain-containing protein
LAAGCALTAEDELRLVQHPQPAAVSLAPGHLAGLDSLVIIRERLIALVAPDHPLSGRRRCTLADITGHPIVCMPARRSPRRRRPAASRGAPSSETDTSADFGAYPDPTGAPGLYFS